MAAAGIEDLPLKQLMKVMNANPAKWPLFIDPDTRAQVFFQYSGGAQLNTLNHKDMDAERIRKAFLNAVRYGSWVNFDLSDFDGVAILKERMDQVKKGFWNDIISKNLLKPEVYLQLVQDSDGPEYNDLMFMDETIDKCRVIFTTTKEAPEKELLDCTTPYRIIV